MAACATRYASPDDYEIECFWHALQKLAAAGG